MPDNLNLTDYFYTLPEELIAQTPAEKRDLSRLLVLDRNDGKLIHRNFCDIIEYIGKGDALVINNSKVIPARLHGRRYLKDYNGKETGELSGLCEVLLLERKSDHIWETIVHPGKRLLPGTRLCFGDRLNAEILSVGEEGSRFIRFDYEGEFFSLLDEIGEMPLPPYIHSRESDKNRYQTVYAKHEGSSAAPTAGLHFTEELLQTIRDKGVEIIPVTLHVGLGTFRPVKVENISAHKMHSEYYSITEESAQCYNRVKQNGGKIFAVGTTSCRTLESAVDENGLLQAGGAYTNIFIYPGYHFRAVDKLITNFHLPESTLIMLVSALADREKILHAYAEAVQQKYRFFSFGDAMLIL